MADQKYQIVQRLAAGGMAEVFLGESLSVQGFKKQVAIKRVLPHLGQNQKFIQMFLDEARLSAHLNHANVVTVFDIGSTDNTYFLVMEYVDGTNLKELMENVRKSRMQFEPKQAIFIGMEACRGLHYAHELTDHNGTPLGIVHRDVSPPNIMITKRGEIKITDFGLAKAGIQVEKTEPGVVKGKFGYLAPEVASGENADARCDVFSLGIVLWEMLAGRRLFLGETDYQTVKLVKHANIPRLSMLNRRIDESLEEIIYKALARDPQDRYQSAREFGDALAGYLFTKGLKVTAYDIASLVTSHASKRPPQPPQHEQSIMNKLMHEEMARFTSLDDDAEKGSANGTDPFGQERLSSTFENPADWFSSDSDFPHDVITSTREKETGKAVKKKPFMAPKPPQNPPPPPAKKADNIPAPPAVPKPPETRPSAPRLDADSDASSQRESKPQVKTAASLQETTRPPSKGGGGVKYLLIAAVVAALCAAAWFGNFIP